MFLTPVAAISQLTCLTAHLDFFHDLPQKFLFGADFSFSQSLLHLDAVDIFSLFGKSSRAK